MATTHAPSHPLLPIGAMLLAASFGSWAQNNNSETTLGTVTVCTGDYILGDRDGLVVIPQAMIQDVLDKTEQVASTENLVRDAIRGGMDPVQAYLKYGKF